MPERAVEVREEAVHQDHLRQPGLRGGIDRAQEQAIDDDDVGRLAPCLLHEVPADAGVAEHVQHGRELPVRRSGNGRIQRGRMAVRDEFGAGGLHLRRLPGVPEEADPVSLPQQLAADAQGRGKVAAGVERGEEEIRHHVLLKP